jgi:hypothetical protein
MCVPCTAQRSQVPAAARRRSHQRVRRSARDATHLHHTHLNNSIGPWSKQVCPGSPPRMLHPGRCFILVGAASRASKAASTGARDIAHREAGRSPHCPPAAPRAWAQPPPRHPPYPRDPALRTTCAPTSIRRRSPSPATAFVGCQYTVRCSTSAWTIWGGGHRFVVGYQYTVCCSTSSWTYGGVGILIGPSAVVGRALDDGCHAY